MNEGDNGKLQKLQRELNQIHEEQIKIQESNQLIISQNADLTNQNINLKQLLIISHDTTNKLEARMAKVKNELSHAKRIIKGRNSEIRRLNLKYKTLLNKSAQLIEDNVLVKNECISLKKAINTEAEKNANRRKSKLLRLLLHEKMTKFTIQRFNLFLSQEDGLQTFQDLCDRQIDPKSAKDEFLKTNPTFSKDSWNATFECSTTDRKYTRFVILIRCHVGRTKLGLIKTRFETSQEFSNKLFDIISESDEESTAWNFLETYPEYRRGFHCLRMHLFGLGTPLED